MPRLLRLGLLFCSSAMFAQVVPVVPTKPFVVYLPHVIVGAGYVTKITIVNLAPGANTVVLNIVSASGTVVSQNVIPMAGGATARIQSPEGARFQALTSQWAVAGADLPISVNLFFEFIADPASGAVVNTIGFNDAPPLTGFTLPVEFEPKPANASIGRTIGIAFANTSGLAGAVTLKLLDQTGATKATHVENLDPFAKKALDLQLSVPEFAGVLPAGNFLGSVAVSSTVPISVVALGDDFGPFSAIPTMPARGTSPITLVGNWSLAGNSSLAPGTSFVIGAAFNQTGSALSGLMQIFNSNCFDPTNKIPFTGTVTGNSVAVTSSPANGQVVSATGTVSTLGTTLNSGTYSITGSGCAVGDHGSIAGGRAGTISGNWTGKFQSTFGPTTDISASLVQSETFVTNGFPVTGTLTFTSPCFASGSVAGTLAGMSLTATVTTSNGTVTFSGQASSSSQQGFIGTYSVTGGSCAGDTGSGSISKFN